MTNHNYSATDNTILENNNKSPFLDKNSWQWQIDNLISISEIVKNLPKSLAKDIIGVNDKYPLKVTPYYANLIDKKKIPNDPIFQQVIPSICELSNEKFTNEDPLGEESQMVVENLIHRYKDRVVLLTTNSCAIHCRFCLRKRKWKNGKSQTKISNQNLDEICNYLQSHNEVKELLISGGDPLMLSTCELRNILLRISQIPSIDIIRIGTRVPVVLPMRVDDQLVKMISEFSGVWLATHFNHPTELTSYALLACNKFIKSGIPVINQTVLLKNINDSADILEILFRKLAANKIKPHYLFHIDPVNGNEHFATGISVGLKIMKQLRNRISSLATPVFAIDLPEGGGKVPLLPNYKHDNGFESIDSRIIPYL